MDFWLDESNFVVLAVGRIISGRSFGKRIIISLSFRVGTSKNENIDHRGKETCAIMSTKVPHETNHISLLLDSKMSGALNFCFSCILL